MEEEPYLDYWLQGTSPESGGGRRSTTKSLFRLPASAKSFEEQEILASVKQYKETGQIGKRLQDLPD
jgi:hypothetical protein